MQVIYEIIKINTCFLRFDSLFAIPYILVVMTITEKVDEGDEKLFKSIANCANEMAALS